MKVGDLVKFKEHGGISPLGVVLEFRESLAGAQRNMCAKVRWFSEHTPNGYWGLELIEVVEENSERLEILDEA